MENAVSRITGAARSCPWYGRLPTEPAETGEETVIPAGAAIILVEGRAKRLFAFPEGGRIRGRVRMVLIPDAAEDAVARADPLRWPRIMVIAGLLLAAALLVIRADVLENDIFGLLMPLLLLMGFASRITRVRRERHPVETRRIGALDA